MSEEKYNDGRIFVSCLIRFTRANISAISKITGLSPASIRNRVRRLVSKGLVDFKPLFSSKVLGNEAALIRVRSEKKEGLLKFLSSCNRVIGVMNTNSNEVIAMVYGRDKNEIASLVSAIKYLFEEISEVEIRYGKLPSDFMIPLKNDRPDCYKRFNHEIFTKYCGSCIPDLKTSK
ncbi:winged helix-turn-helix transcriptional regulator [Thermogladius sp. 4427co]|uniref:winged helix-turn-helix transcriptional regulator n=1 Tax=Thermogladius sp. 4427co TaxID=3450718 RepID=UPI003F79D760